MQGFNIVHRCIQLIRIVTQLPCRVAQTSASRPGQLVRLNGTVTSISTRNSDVELQGSLSFTGNRHTARVRVAFLKCCTNTDASFKDSCTSITMPLIANFLFFVLLLVKVLRPDPPRTGISPCADGVFSNHEGGHVGDIRL